LRLERNFFGSGVWKIGPYHHEVLVSAVRARQARTLDADDLDRQPAWKSNSVGQDVAGVCGKTHVDRMFARFGKQTLRELGRQPVLDGHCTLKNAVCFGVHGPNGMAVILGSLFKNDVELID